MRSRPTDPRSSPEISNDQIFPTDLLRQQVMFFDPKAYLIPRLCTMSLQRGPLKCIRKFTGAFGKITSGGAESTEFDGPLRHKPNMQQNYTHWSKNAKYSNWSKLRWVWRFEGLALIYCTVDVLGGIQEAKGKSLVSDMVDYSVVSGSRECFVLIKTPVVPEVSYRWPLGTTIAVLRLSAITACALLGLENLLFAHDRLQPLFYAVSNIAYLSLNAAVLTALYVPTRSVGRTIGD